MKPRKVTYLHGQNDIFKKSSNLIENYSNKNDVINILGPSLVKVIDDNNTWHYFEIIEYIDIYGKKKTLKDETIVLKFNKNGVLKKKIYYNKNTKTNIPFDKNKTVSAGVDNSIVKSIIKSSKKRFEKQKGKIDSLFD